MSTVDASGAIHGTDGKFVGHVSSESTVTLASTPVVPGIPQNAEQMDRGDDLAADVLDVNLALHHFDFPARGALTREAHGASLRSIRHELGCRFPGSAAVVLEYDHDSRDWYPERVLDGSGEPMVLDADGNTYLELIDAGELTDRMWDARANLANYHPEGAGRTGSVTLSFEQIDQDYPPRTPQQASADLDSAIDSHLADVQRRTEELRSKLATRRSNGEPA